MNLVSTFPLRALCVGALVITGGVAKASTLYGIAANRQISYTGTFTPTVKLDVVGGIKVTGKIQLPQSGDLSMGSFTVGTNPTP